MPTKLNLIGYQFGKLKVIEEATKYKSKSNERTRWICKCKCGNTKEIVSTSLTSGNTKSCGCVHKEKSKERLTKHDIGKRPSKEYSLERKNNKVGYNKNNCIWATKEKQNQNKSNSKLTPKLVVELRKIKPKYTYKKLQDIYGISATTIRNAVVGKTWKNIPFPPYDEKP